MISSMTGFAHHEKVENNKKCIVELKSVNHRYLDLGMKLSKKITFLDQKIRNTIKKSVGRGKVDIYVHFEEAAEDSFNIRYNREIASEYYQNMISMSKEFGIENDIKVSDLAAFPDVFELVAAEKDEDAIWEFVGDAVENALDIFLKTRSDEGERLSKDLTQKLDALYSDVLSIEEKSPQIVEEYKARLIKKLDDLIIEHQIDDSRIAAEVTIYADKICVDEEIVRLKSHITQMRDTLKTGGAVGRKLDFLAQELNREANTILSKSTDAAVADIGISMKTLIEKIREQIQNLE